jgi:2-methylisocitrate lyase-like PEP mutase family enzyme
MANGAGRQTRAAALRAGMESGQTVVAIGAHDALSGRLVEQAGFDAIYVGSYATEATALGGPDLALMSKTDRLAISRNIVKATSIPVIVDMEEGYGNAINVMDAVRDFEAAGVAAIHIDDQDLPSKCPFLPGIPRNTLVSVDEMCGKIRAAREARENSDFVIIARTDVIGTVARDRYYAEQMMDEVVARSKAYLAAGADVAFIMALTRQELEFYRAAISGPLVGIFATVEPLPIRDFEETRYEMVIGSLVSLYLVARALRDGLAELRRTGDWNALADRMVDDPEFFRMVGLDRYGSAYEQYHID